MKNRPYLLALFFGFFLGMNLFLLLDGLRLIDITANNTVNEYLVRMLASGVIGSVLLLFVVFIIRIFRRNDQ